MSRTRLAGLLLFLFIPLVLVLFLRMPLGLAGSILAGIAIMLAHRRVARPFMDRHLAVRCFWCGCDGGATGVDAAFHSGRETIAARACCEGHASDLRALGRVVAGAKLALGVAIFVPLVVYLVNALLSIGGWAPLSLDAARWVFKVPIAAAVVALSFAWPYGRTMSREPAIDFPVHNLSLLGARWTLWVFRLVGLFWLGQAVFEAIRR